jgi:hypothetical protein
MINIQALKHDEKKISSAFGLTVERYEEINELLKHRHNDDKYKDEGMSNILQWICFTEELNSDNERVLALFLTGMNAGGNRLRRMLGFGNDD